MAPARGQPGGGPPHRYRCPEAGCGRTFVEWRDLSRHRRYFQHAVTRCERCGAHAATLAEVTEHASARPACAGARWTGRAYRREELEVGYVPPPDPTRLDLAPVLHRNLSWELVRAAWDNARAAAGEARRARWYASAHAESVEEALAERDEKSREAGERASSGRLQLLAAVRRRLEELVRGSSLQLCGSVAFAELAGADADVDINSLSLPREVGVQGKDHREFVDRCALHLKETSSDSSERCFRDVEAVTHERVRVPVVRFTHVETGLTGNITAGTNNVLKSRSLALVLQIDRRVPALARAVKSWAKRRKIADPATGTLNSFAWTLLSVFHCQTRDPPILPPLDELMLDDPGSRDYLAEDVDESAAIDRAHLEALEEAVSDPRWAKLAGMNHETLGELLASFFKTYAANVDLFLQGLVVSCLTGSWCVRAEGKWTGAAFAVEDPWEPTQNVARTLRAGPAGGVLRVRAELERACDLFQDGPPNVEEQAPSPARSRSQEQFRMLFPELQSEREQDDAVPSAQDVSPGARLVRELFAPGVLPAALRLGGAATVLGGAQHA